MSDVHTYSSDVAFTPAVKAIQARKGSRDGYARGRAERRLAHRDRRKARGRFSPTQQPVSATANADGQPYIQHRGGPKGFVKVLDKNTLAFADYSGNRQYITQGNLSENPKAHIFLMDYAHRRRVKIWGEARVVDDDPALTAIADAARLQGAARTGDPVQDFGMGHQLPAAHPAEIRCRRCRGGAGRARCAHRRTGGRTRRIEGPAAAAN